MPLKKHEFTPESGTVDTYGIGTIYIRPTGLTDVSKVLYVITVNTSKVILPVRTQMNVV